VAVHGYRVAVVTGASRGIGAAIVRALVPLGIEVHAVARSKEKLDRLAAETGCLPHALDLTDRAALHDLFGRLEADILVNNLGAVTTLKPTHEADPADLDAMIELNLATACQALRGALPGMIARDRGHVFLLGSIAGVHILPGLPVYGATKAAIHSLTHGLRLELVGKRIRVTEILPGRVETDIYVEAYGGDRAAAYERLFDRYESLQPEDVANGLVYALTAPPHVNVSHLEIVPTMQALGGNQFPATRG
jgi:NADP-dependent 3-hydroxy acid dehydrogenase YdfG